MDTVGLKQISLKLVHAFPVPYGFNPFGAMSIEYPAGKVTPQVSMN